jgi:hypothetical protein
MRPFCLLSKIKICVSFYSRLNFITMKSSLLKQSRLKNPVILEFPCLLHVFASYKTLLSELKGEFENRFMDFKNITEEICAFSAILRVDVPRHLQIEVIQLKNDLVYSPLFAPDQDLLRAYQSLPPTSYPGIRRFAARFISMFGSTYRCEQLFSKMGYAKNRYR